MSDPDRDLEATARIARDLIRFDTTNYGEGRSNGEAEAADYVATELRELGLEPVLIDSQPRRTSVVARMPGTDRNRPALVVHGHLDVVPADPANWSVDPFGGEIRDGMRFLYERVKLACEPAGAAATAALLAGKVDLELGRPVAVVVSGGNVAARTASAILAGE